MSVDMYGIYEMAIKSTKLNNEQLEFCLNQILSSPETCLRVIKCSGIHMAKHENLCSIIKSILSNKKTRKIFISAKTSLTHIQPNIYDVIINLLNSDEVIIFLDNLRINKVYMLKGFIENYYMYLTDEKQLIVDTYLITKKLTNDMNFKNISTGLDI